MTVYVLTHVRYRYNAEYIAEANATNTFYPSLEKAKEELNAMFKKAYNYWGSMAKQYNDMEWKSPSGKTFIRKEIIDFMPA